MAKITINQSVHVDITIDGERAELDLTPGDTEVASQVAQLLIDQGFATDATNEVLKPSKSKNSPIAPVEDAPTAEPSEA